MHRVLTIARRDYLAAVRTKAFLLSLLLVPVLSGFAIFMQVLSAKADFQTNKTYAIVDRTRALKEPLERSNERRNASELVNPVTKARIAPSFTLVFVEPSPDVEDEILRQRAELSKRHQRGELDGFLEIGPDVFEITPPGAAPDDRREIRYQSEKAIEREFPTWAAKAVNYAVQERRFGTKGIDVAVVREIQTSVVQRNKGVTTVDPTTGKLVDATEDRRVATLLLPAVLVGLMMIVVLLSAMPAMQGIVEEKQQRIAEVLLGCASPFELMLGKLLGVVAVSLTISMVYLAGGGFVAVRVGADALVSPGLVAWFLVFLLLATLVYGSLFMAIGAAATDLKETQSLQMPVMSVAMLPLLLLGTLIREPNGKLAIVGSFIPFSSPMLMTARLSTSATVPLWQPIVAALGVLLTALFCVWAAGRIFRVGLLMQGKGVRFADLVKWVVSG